MVFMVSFPALQRSVIIFAYRMKGECALKHVVCTNEVIKVTAGGERGALGDGPNNDRCDNYDVLNSRITCTSQNISTGLNLRDMTCGWWTAHVHAMKMHYITRQTGHTTILSSSWTCHVQLHKHRVDQVCIHVIILLIQNTSINWLWLSIVPVWQTLSSPRSTDHFI